MLKRRIGLVDHLTILIALNSTAQLAYLEEAQLIERFVNYQTFVKYLNHLFKLRHDGIKLSFLQKCSTSFSWIEPTQKSNGRNNFDTQYCKCSISNINFNTCIYPVYQGRFEENYKTLHRFVLLRKLSGEATKKPAEGMISRPLLPKVIYRIQLLLPRIRRLFRYH